MQWLWCTVPPFHPAPPDSTPRPMARGWAPSTRFCRSELPTAVPPRVTRFCRSPMRIVAALITPFHPRQPQQTDRGGFTPGSPNSAGRLWLPAGASPPHSATTNQSRGWALNTSHSHAFASVLRGAGTVSAKATDRDAGNAVTGQKVVDSWRVKCRTLPANIRRVAVGCCRPSFRRPWFRRDAARSPRRAAPRAITAAL